MPTEHEFKYVIDLKIHDDIDREDLLSMCESCYEIEQGYLVFSKGISVRIRSQEKIGTLKKKWVFNFKQKVSDRVIEIEKKISERDAKDLWPFCLGKLKKNRYVIDDKGVTWELDFFWKGAHLYFVQAEVELNEGAERPQEVPDFMDKYVVYEVPFNDWRFANKRLGDVEYATKLYKEVSHGKIST